MSIAAQIAGGSVLDYTFFLLNTTFQAVRSHVRLRAD
jgi:hypothetical protein